MSKNDGHYPIFCPDCRKSNTFVRLPGRDIKCEDGSIFELVYVCSCCGYLAYEVPPVMAPKGRGKR
jgi:hypothetical protein